MRPSKAHTWPKKLSFLTKHQIIFVDQETLQSPKHFSIKNLYF